MFVWRKGLASPLYCVGSTYTPNHKDGGMGALYLYHRAIIAGEMRERSSLSSTERFVLRRN